MNTAKAITWFTVLPAAITNVWYACAVVDYEAAPSFPGFFSVAVAALSVIAAVVMSAVWLIEHWND